MSDFIARVEELLGPETNYDTTEGVDDTSRGPIYDDVYDKDGNLIVGPSVMD
jgi:hypothetical protein